MPDIGESVDMAATMVYILEVLTDVTDMIRPYWVFIVGLWAVFSIWRFVVNQFRHAQQVAADNRMEGVTNQAYSNFAPGEDVAEDWNGEPLEDDWWKGAEERD